MNLRMLLSRRQLLSAAFAAPTLALPAWAQGTWPSKVIRLVVPLPAGGSVDASARALGEQLGAVLKQSVVIDNRPGAGGLLGIKGVAQTAPDGYTLGYIHSGLLTVQAMNPSLDLLKELRPVAKLWTSQFVAVVRSDSKHKTFNDLIAAVQTSPGKLTHSSGGIGSPTHLVAELINEQTGSFKALHVPYKGGIEAAAAVIAGEVDFAFVIIGTVASLLPSGKLRVLGVTSRERLTMMPEVPTIGETLPGFAFESWGGLAAPAGTPDSVIGRLNEVLPEITTSVRIKEVLAKGGSLPDLVGPRLFIPQIAREIEEQRTLVKKLGMTNR